MFLGGVIEVKGEHENIQQSFLRADEDLRASMRDQWSVFDSIIIRNDTALRQDFLLLEEIHEGDEPQIQFPHTDGGSSHEINYIFLIYLGAVVRKVQTLVTPKSNADRLIELIPEKLSSEIDKVKLEIHKTLSRDIQKDIIHLKDRIQRQFDWNLSDCEKVKILKKIPHFSMHYTTRDSIYINQEGPLQLKHGAYFDPYTHDAADWYGQKSLYDLHRYSYPFSDEEL